MATILDYVGKRGFLVCDFRLNKDVLTSLLGSDSNTQLPWSAISSILESLGCSTVVIEEDYYDKHYLSEYCHSHSKKNIPPGARCVRLHFFGDPLGLSDLYSESIKTKLPSYLGFSVIRPTANYRIGRTVLKPPQSGYDMPCWIDVRSHLTGNVAITRGLPFISKDGATMMCAHSALWMLLSYLTGLEHTREFSSHGVRELADGSLDGVFGDVVRPGSGMVLTQFVAALRLAGSVPIAKPFSGLAEDAGQLAYRYLCAGIPVLAAAFKYFDTTLQQCVPRNEWQRARPNVDVGGHAFLLVGFREEGYVDSPSFEERKNNSGQVTSRIFDHARTIKSYLKHDDLIGPYAPLAIGPSGKPADRYDYFLSEVTALIVPLPENVFVDGQQAFELAADFIHNVEHLLPAGEHRPEQFKQFLETRKNGVILRTFLAPSNDYRCHVAQLSSVMHPHVRLLYLWTEMPKYVWVAEISTVEHMKAGTVLGECILDPTSVGKPGLLAIHVPGLLVACDRVFASGSGTADEVLFVPEHRERWVWDTPELAYPAFRHSTSR